MPNDIPSKQTVMQEITMMDVRLDNLSMNETIVRIEELIGQKKNALVITCNIDHVVKLHHDHDFRNIYQEAELVVADGVGVLVASRILKKPLKERVCGTDLFHLLCKHCEEKGFSVYIFGGRDERSVNGTVEKLKANFPKLKIAGSDTPAFGFEKDEAESTRLSVRIRDAKPDVLFVGVGAPKQEKWIYKYRNIYNCAVSIGVGSAFNFYSGNVKRAPLWMQNNGLEWFHRVLHDRRLFKRYFIDDVEFLFLLLKEMRSSSRSK